MFKILSGVQTMLWKISILQQTEIKIDLFKLIVMKITYQPTARGLTTSGCLPVYRNSPVLHNGCPPVALSGSELYDRLSRRMQPNPEEHNIYEVFPFQMDKCQMFLQIFLLLNISQ